MAAMIFMGVFVALLVSKESVDLISRAKAKRHSTLTTRLWSRMLKP